MTENIDMEALRIQRLLGGQIDANKELICNSNAYRLEWMDAQPGQLQKSEMWQKYRSMLSRRGKVQGLNEMPAIVKVALLSSKTAIPVSEL